MKHERPAFIDLPLDRVARAGAAVDFAEPKHDGEWCWLVSDGSTVQAYSRTGKPQRVSVPACGRSFVLAGEFMAGSQRAASSPLRGAVVVFDCLELDGACLESAPLSERRQAAAQIVAATGAPLVLVEQVPGAQAAELLARVLADGGEGIVLKFDDAWGREFIRAKRVETFDVVCLSAGARSFEVGFWTPAGVRSAGKVQGSASAAQVGQVVEVTAMERTQAGKLRHGRVLRWRSDKAPCACR